MFLSGTHALKSHQREFLQGQTASRHATVSKKLSEEVFSFHQAGSMPSLLASENTLKLRAHKMQLGRSTGSNSTYQVIDPDMEVDPQPWSISVRIYGGLAGLQFLAKIVGVLMLVFFLAGMAAWVLHCYEDDSEAGDPMDRVLASCTNQDQSLLPKTQEMLEEALEGSALCNDGTWARTYRRADGKQKEGLELLFRCGIVPQTEFASSTVSLEHINECMWISRNMLRQRPLEEWLAQTPEAQQTFEKSVTAVFSARTDGVFSARTDVLDIPSREPSSWSSPENLPPMMPSPAGRAERSAPTDSMQHRPSSINERIMQRALKQVGARPEVPAQMSEDVVLHSQEVPVAQTAEDDVLRSQDASGQNLLMARCRELMAANRPPKLPAQEPVVPERGAPAQSLALDATVPGSGRVKLIAFEAVITEGQDDAAAFIGGQAGGWSVTQQYQEGSAAACSTSAFLSREPAYTTGGMAWDTTGCESQQELSVETQQGVNNARDRPDSPRGGIAWDVSTGYEAQEAYDADSLDHIASRMDSLRDLMDAEDARIYRADDAHIEQLQQLEASMPWSQSTLPDANAEITSARGGVAWESPR